MDITMSYIQARKLVFRKFNFYEFTKLVNNRARNLM